ncbi:hypothetical protein TNCV_4716041 [Trichonephila clavipes]|nr:hypothetical protein TNCV_4716041 [Trichonephila clavipes]
MAHNEENYMRIGVAEYRSWFVTGPLHPRLRVRPPLQSVNFHDAENRQRHVKDTSSALSVKLNSSTGSHRQSSGAAI